MWSAAYWIAVGVGTVVFSLDILFVMRGRESSRLYPEAVAFYVVGLSVSYGLVSLVIVLARALKPGEHFFAGTPTAAVVAALIVLVGGHALAMLGEAFTERDSGAKPILEHDPTPQELASAEAYDVEWHRAVRAARTTDPLLAELRAASLRERVDGESRPRGHLPDASREPARSDQVPDLSQEILGWKVLAFGEGGHLWHRPDRLQHIVAPTGLSSPTTAAEWPPHRWLEATCSFNPDHHPPVEECTCGIYAVDDSSAALPYEWEAPLTVLVRVGLAGKVIPGTRGWRAERARVVALTRTGAGSRDYPQLLAHVAHHYGVPILDLDSLARDEEEIAAKEEH